VYFTAANQSVTLVDNTSKIFVLPTGLLELNVTNGGADTRLDYRTGTTALPTGAFTTLASGRGAVTIGKQRYYLQNASAAAGGASAANISLADTSSARIDQPAIMVKEKKNDNSEYETVIVKTGDDSNGINVDTGVVFSGFSGSGTSTSTSSLTKYLDLWGSLVSLDTSGQGTVTVKTPDTQVSGGVFVLTSAATAPTTTTVGSGTVVQPSLGSGISKLDTEVGADKTAKNLILVGGPAINTLVAELGTDGKSPSLTEWRTQLQGKGIIQSVSNAFQAGKTAIVVAGYEKEETGAAALKLATDSALKGTAKQVMGGVWSDFTYPLPVVETVPENTTEEATPSA